MYDVRLAASAVWLDSHSHLLSFVIIILGFEKIDFLCERVNHAPALSETLASFFSNRIILVSQRSISLGIKYNDEFLGPLGLIDKSSICYELDELG